MDSQSTSHFARGLLGAAYGAIGRQLGQQLDCRMSA